MNHQNTPNRLTHGLQNVSHLPHEDQVIHMSCGEGAGGFVSLHRSGCVRFYHPDGSPREPSVHKGVYFKGLTSTQIPGRLVGWGPGARLVLLDAELMPLVHAQEPLDVRVCQVLEGSQKLVTAGEQNVCVWRVSHLVCCVKVQQGFGKKCVFTQLALLPAAARKPPRALAVSGRSIAVVDLREGRVLEHRTNLHPREITAVVFCPLQDAVVTASEDANIRVWGSNWELLMTFVSHADAVTSLLSCPVSGLLVSSSLDSTLRCWSLETGDQVQTVTLLTGHTPVLSVGGPSCDCTFFSFSKSGVDFWTFTSLYHLHCKLGSNKVHQISASPSHPAYPARLLCLHGDSDVTLLSADTGAVLTGLRFDMKVKYADYCLFKELLLVLTEEGAVLRASTLTNPATRISDSSTVDKGLGQACCMALYSHIADPETALEEWKQLQEQRGKKTERRNAMEDKKNRFLVMLGHRGGCVSVMQMHSGKVQYRVSAHDGQDVQIIQAYPDNNTLLTAGDDSVLVWSVFPYVQECVCVQTSVSCAHTPVCVSLLESLLAICLQNQHSATYSLVQYNIDVQTHTRYEHPPEHDHWAAITGLCVCQTLGVFASCSLDGTVRIWDEENHLLRTLELCAEPECVQFSGCRGELLLGIRGDIYKIHLRPLLPPDYQLWELWNEDPLDPVPDLPITCTPTKICNQRSHAEEETNNPDLECLLERNQDLRSLQSGNTHSKKKPTSTTNTRRETSNHFVNIPDQDPFDIHATLTSPKLSEPPTLTPPTLREGVFPDTTHTQESLCPVPATPGFIPNSGLEEEFWLTVFPSEPLKLRDDLNEKCKPDEDDKLNIDSPVHIIETSPITQSPPMYQSPTLTPSPSLTPPLTPPPRTTPPLSPPPPEKPMCTLTPLMPLPPIKQFPTTTAPPSPPRSAPHPTPRTPSPCLRQFLHQFLQEPWFHVVYPDLSTIPESLSADDFCVQLLDFLKLCVIEEKLRILKAIVTLQTHNLLNNTHNITQSLLDLLHSYLNNNMNNEEQKFVGELLSILVYLNPQCYDIIVELLSLLANKHLRLRGLAVCMLQSVGLDEPQRWLLPHLETWDSEAQRHKDPQRYLRETARCWLDRWITKYRLHKRLREKTIPLLEVLHYFCQVEQQAQVKPPEGRKDTVLLEPRSYRWTAVQRLGETNSMMRTREPRDLWLPPLSSKPSLVGFTRLLSLPVPQVTVSSFPFALKVRCLKENPPLRYFLLERSYVHYYRQNNLK